MSKMLRLPPVLRPRLTWRYVVCATAALYVSYCFLFDSPLLASKLPQYTGPHPVGAIDIESPCEHRSISSFKVRETGEPALQLDTVLFTLYYPAKNHRSKARPRHYWIPKPVSITGEGYLRFGGVNNFITNNIVTGALWGLAGGLTIPAAVDVPLADEPLLLESQDDFSIQMVPQKHEGLPVLVFSHGFASSRTDYTHYLGELASRGYVVAAIEHRDGSGPGSLVMKKGMSNRTAFPIKFSHVTDASDSDASAFKQAQLDFRQAEVEETIRVLKTINEGHGAQIFTTNSRHEGSDLTHWKGQLNTQAITIAGHSFGATLALQTLKDAPSPSLPLAGCIALDPGKSSGRLNSAINVPTLIIHSNSWSATHSIFYGRPHFDVVRDLVADLNTKGGQAGWFMTSLGTSHPSVTDAPLIEPLLLSWTTGATIDVVTGVAEYVAASEGFLKYQHTGVVAGLLAQPVSHPEYKDPRGDKSVLEPQYRRYWQVHVAPELAV
jgi:platelet-activating factor acetylhydrolase